ncbi:MAG TPA: ATP-binding protein [Planctomycetia bacterium]|nr:ATP-binding protein [Planctomycetia bacterium]
MRFRWRIRQKLGAGLLLVVGMTALLSGAAFYGIYSYRDTNKNFEYHAKQLENIENLVLLVSDLYWPAIETVEGNSPAARTREHHAERLQVIRKQLVQFRDRLAEGNRRGIVREPERKEFAVKLMLDEVQALQAANEKAPNEALPPAEVPTAFILWRGGGDEFKRVIALRNALDTLRGQIHIEITRGVGADRNNYRTCMALIYSTSGLALVMLGSLVWLGYQALFDPIRALYRGVAKLAAGEFDSRVRLDSGDEMQELGEAFNQMADRLQAIYRDLNTEVEQRSRQLIRSERLASVGFLAAGVAHEINNPLASIAFCGEALESRLKDLLAEEDSETEVVKNYLTMIQQEAFRCKAITEKLLNFSRTGAPERIDADCAALVRDVLEMVRHLGRTRGKQMIFEPTESVFCFGNPQELKQVLLNLVVNALESVDEGGEVRVSARNVGNQAVISVSDDGCGMTPDVLENLFEPFFTRSRSGKGTGLGLSISHLIVSQHGGRLSATSDGPNRGSTFTVALPTRPAARRAA